MGCVFTDARSERRSTRCTTSSSATASFQAKQDTSAHLGAATGTNTSAAALHRSQVSPLHTIQARGQRRKTWNARETTGMKQPTSLPPASPDLIFCRALARTAGKNRQTAESKARRVATP